MEKQDLDADVDTDADTDMDTDTDTDVHGLCVEHVTWLHSERNESYDCSEPNRDHF